MNVRGVMAAVSFGIVLSGQPVADERLILSTFENSGLTLVQEPILREAYHRLGIDIDVLQLPAERALRMANAGQVDGEVARVALIRHQYPELVMVPEPLLHIENVVFSKDLLFPIDGYQSLRPYQVVTLRGYKHFESQLLGQGVNYSLVGSYDQVFRTIEKDRYQVALLTRLDGMKTLSELGVRGIYALEPPLEVIPVYHFLHRRHTQLVPQLAKVLREMRETGVIDQIQLEVLGELLNQVSHHQN